MPSDNKVFNERLVHGRRRVQVWRRIGAVQFANYQDRGWLDNAIVNTGIDSILQMLGNKIMHFHFNQIGTGDSATPISGSESDLLGTNKLWKTVPVADIVYVRPNLLLTIILGYSEANFVLREYGVRNNNNELVSRVLDATPLTKTSSDLVMVQFQYSIPQVS